MKGDGRRQRSPSPSPRRKSVDADDKRKGKIPVSTSSNGSATRKRITNTGVNQNASSIGKDRATKEETAHSYFVKRLRKPKSRRKNEATIKISIAMTLQHKAGATPIEKRERFHAESEQRPCSVSSSRKTKMKRSRNSVPRRNMMQRLKSVMQIRQE